jgi:hypothetical protein
MCTICNHLVLFPGAKGLEPLAFRDRKEPKKCFVVGGQRPVNLRVAEMEFHVWTQYQLLMSRALMAGAALGAISLFGSLLLAESEWCRIVDSAQFSGLPLNEA